MPNAASLKRPPATSKIARRIQRARWDAGLSQEKLAAKAGTSRHNVMRWEAGKNEPRLKFLRAIADATGKDLSFFTDEDDEEEDAAVTLDEILRARIRSILNEELGKVAR